MQKADSERIPSSSVSFENIFDITLPEALSSKIYRNDGTTCNQPYLSSYSILLDLVKIGANIFNVSLISFETNKLRVQLGQQSLNSGSSIQVNIRIPIFLDIGTVQS